MPSDPQKPPRFDPAVHPELAQLREERRQDAPAVDTRQSSVPDNFYRPPPEPFVAGGDQPGFNGSEETLRVLHEISTNLSAIRTALDRALSQ